MGRRAGAVVVYLRDDSGIYWCSFTAKGKRYRLSTGERDKSRAEESARKLQAQAELGVTAVRPARYRPKGNLEDLTTRYCAWLRASLSKSYAKTQQNHLTSQFLDRWSDLCEITPQAIGAWRVERMKDDITTVTLYKNEVTLKRFLAWCKDVAGVLDEVPHFQHVVPVSKYVPPDVNREETLEWLALLPDRTTHRKKHPVREFYTVTWAQAFRLADTQRLCWQQVDFRAGTITIPKGSDKAKGEWVLPLTGAARAVLEGMSAGRTVLPSALVFGRHDYRGSLELARAKAGIRRGSTHTLRHSRLSELGGVTQDIGALREFARHRSMNMTDRYVRSRLPRIEALVAAADSVTVRDTKKKPPREKQAVRGRMKR